MKPESPVILIEWPDALVEIVWGTDELQERLERIPHGRQLEILDSTGGRFLTEHDQDGTVRITCVGNDSDAVKMKLMALARAELRFDPEELKSAQAPRDMFAAFERQTKMPNKAAHPTAGNVLL
jgi:hypothetical protein